MNQKSLISNYILNRQIGKVANSHLDAAEMLAALWLLAKLCNYQQAHNSNIEYSKPESFIRIESRGLMTIE